MQIEDSVAINQPFVSITPNTIEQIVNQDNREEEQVYEVNESTSTEFVDVQNPSKAIGRGRPPKHRYESSIEKVQSCNGNSTRGPYKCCTCGQVGHNAAFHKK
ncbi:protein far1-related sequence 11-like isoform x1 [Gigaspora margarita]|uniref:Protein far1-related sequence 11-like isoform x1 n=1 Tax=Gigaspora margarita TaxID=4874 RepID=A0A8H3X917_GIGMA|nr:protein far1-related sequence 11-like isoform x1 [Gigaspora margarita]